MDCIAGAKRVWREHVVWVDRKTAGRRLASGESSGRVRGPRICARVCRVWGEGNGMAWHLQL